MSGDLLKQEIATLKTKLREKIDSLPTHVRQNFTRPFQELIGTTNDSITRMETMLDDIDRRYNDFDYASASQEENSQHERQILLDFNELRREVPRLNRVVNKIIKIIHKYQSQQENVDPTAYESGLPVGSGFGNYVVPEALRPGTTMSLQRRFF